MGNTTLNQIFALNHLFDERVKTEGHLLFNIQESLQLEISDIWPFLEQWKINIYTAEWVDIIIKNKQ